MAEFWPDNQSESSCAKIVKSSSADQPVITGSQSGVHDPPTVLSSSSSKSLLAISSDPAAPVVRELAGEMLAHFRLDDYVGVGGMGAVFRATDMRLDRPVALKILPPEQARDPEIVQRFQHEARASARLDHENIARVFFVGEDRGLHFIAFEFVEGVNVRELITQCGPLPPHEVVNYALQITGALVHATSRGVVHRDIKPSNIIITLAGRAKLVDMGLARNFERRHDGGLTQSNVTLGTFDYIAPEQARDPRSADVRSDIYSLGCTLFHMLTGQPPYPEGTVLQKLLKHQGESPPNASEFNPKVPSHLAALVQRMMAKEQARRQQSPQVLLSELLEIAADMGLRSTSPEGLIWVAEQPGASMSKLTSAVWLTAAAVLIVAVWRLYTTSAETTIPGPIPAAAADSPTLNVGTSHPPTNTSANSENDPGQTQDLPEPDGVRGAAPIGPGVTGDPAPGEPPSPEAGVVVIGPGQDLRAAISQAPSGSVIELIGDHRPQMMHKVDDTAGLRIEGKRLTIRAAPGSRARLILSYDSQTFGVSDWNLLTVVNGQLELEGVHLELQYDANSIAAMSMVACESSRVTFRRCSFLQSPLAGAVESARRDEDASVWVAHLDSAVTNESQPSRIVASECFFGGGDGAFDLIGSSRMDLTDCVFLPYRAPFHVRATRGLASQPTELRLNNISLFGNGTPIFDLTRVRATVTSQNVIYSHPSPTPGVLVRLDGDSVLDWKGKHNLYQGLHQYLVARTSSGAVPLAGRLSDWLELSREVDEQDSTETDSSPWLITLADAATRNANDPQIADAFRLARRGDDPNWRPLGARFVLPWGALYASDTADITAQRVKQFATPGNSAVAANAIESNRVHPSADPRTDKGPKLEANNGTRSPDTASSNGAKLDMKKIISTMPSGEVTAPPTDTSGSAPRTADPPVSQVPPRGTLIVDPQLPGAFASIGAACSRAEDGGVIEVRYSGRLRESPIELGDRHLTIRAAAGYRPNIEFAVTTFDLRGREPRLFDIRRGSLTIKDLDLHLMADPAISAEPWTIIASRGADLQIDGCTLNVEASPGLIASVVRFLSGDMDDPMAAPNGEPAPPRPQFQLRNSLAVGVTHVVRIQPAVRVRMEIENCAIELQENLLTVAGGLDRGTPGAMNELEIRHATVRAHRGLVNYEASETRSWLPRLEITALDNLFVNDGDAPWIRFRSPRSADEIRGLLRWKGMNNSYDGQAVFWQIENPSAGDIEPLSWEEWSRSPARDEIKADRRHIEFAAGSDNSSPGLRTRNHFKPVPLANSDEMASDGGNRGADLNLIPAPPQERSPATGG